MVGGTTSGYSLIGNRHIAITPTRKITIESTPAKIGRRMKKCEKFIDPEFPLTFRHGWITCAFFLRHHLHSGTDPLESVDYDLFTGLHPGANNTFAIDG